MKNRNVTKLGGAHLHDAAAIRSSITSVLREGTTRISVSAPGTVSDNVPKITDTVISDVIPNLNNGNAWKKSLKPILDRFYEICKGLGIENEFFRSLREQTIRDIEANKYYDFVVSYPERLTAWIIVKWLCNEGYDAKFVDPMETIFLKKDGVNIDLTKTRKSIALFCKGKSKAIFIMPGFHVSDVNGRVKILPRDGTDITGAYFADAVKAARYDMGKDVLGIYTGAPKIVSGWKVNSLLNDKDLRNLTYAGTNAVHTQVIHVLSKRRIPIRVYNPCVENNPGTIITFDQLNDRQTEVIAITGKSKFIGFKVYRRMMNDQVGSLHKMCAVFTKLNISIEHIPTTIDETLFIIDKEKFNASTDLDKIIKGLKRLNPGGKVSVIDGIAVIGVVSTNYNSRAEMIVQNVLRMQSIEPFYFNQMSGLILMAVLDVDLEKLVKLFHKDLFEETDPQPHPDSCSITTQLATKERWQEI